MFNWRYTLAIFIGVSFDHWSKFLARTYLSMDSELVIIPKLLSLQLVFNKGAAWGMFHNYPNVLSAFAITVIMLAFIFQKHFATNTWTKLGLTFIMIGAIGNVSDRILFGKVTDLFNIHIIPVFNVADIMINIGVLFFLIDFIVSHQVKSKDA